MPSLPRFVFDSGHPQPLLHRASPGAEDNLFGFEGGTLLRLDGAYHLFTAEIHARPKVVPTRLAHWRSDDGLAFTRVSTLFASIGDFTGRDERASLWSPMPFYNEAEDRWNLFYVAYKAAPNTPTAHLLNHAGRIVRARSLTAGRAGFGGPYADVEIVLQPGPDSDPWEGLQGVDSFYAYRLDDGSWRAFYGSCHTQNMPCDWWGLGLASAPALAGPWTRCSAQNPVVLDEKFAENPIVTRLADGVFVAIYDSTIRGTFGIATSTDGVNWSRGASLEFPREAFPWLATMRTPLCLLPEPDGGFLLYFTGYDRTDGVAAEEPHHHDGFGVVGRMRIRRV